MASKRTTLAENPQEIELKLFLMGFSNISVHEDLSVTASYTDRNAAKSLNRLPVVFRELSGSFVEAYNVISYRGHLVVRVRTLQELSLERVDTLEATDLSGDLTGSPAVQTLFLYERSRLESLNGLRAEGLKTLRVQCKRLGSLRGMPLVMPNDMLFTVDDPTALESCFGAPLYRKPPNKSNDLLRDFRFPGVVFKGTQVPTLEDYNKAAALMFTMPEESLPLWAADTTKPLLSAWAQMRLQNYNNCNEVFRLEVPHENKTT